MLPISGFRHDEIKVSKAVNFRYDNNIESAIKHTLRKYSKKPYGLETKASAIRFMIKTFRHLDDAGFFDDPVAQERLKTLLNKQK